MYDLTFYSDNIHIKNEKATSAACQGLVSVHFLKIYFYSYIFLLVLHLLEHDSCSAMGGPIWPFWWRALQQTTQSAFSLEGIFIENFSTEGSSFLRKMSGNLERKKIIFGRWQIFIENFSFEGKSFFYRKRLVRRYYIFKKNLVKKN